MNFFLSVTNDSLSQKFLTCKDIKDCADNGFVVVFSAAQNT